jgi:RNA polymerase sigma-70 factor (ECF subfamily)
MASDAATYSADWDGWFSLHGNRLLLFARQQAGPEAEDVLQEALCQLWRLCADAPPDLPLVFHRIRLTAIDFARSRNRRAARETETFRLQQPTSRWFEREDRSGRDAEALELAVRELPPEQQEVVTLKIWGDLTFQEIAETLEIPANTAASRYRYALEKLKDKLTRGNL